MLALLAAALADTGVGDTAVPTTTTTPWTTTTPETGGTYTVWTPGWSRTTYWTAFWDYTDYYWWDSGYYDYYYVDYVDYTTCDDCSGDDDTSDDRPYTDGEPPDEDRSGDTGDDKQITCGNCDGTGAGAMSGLGLALVVVAGIRRRR